MDTFAVIVALTAMFLSLVAMAVTIWRASDALRRDTRSWSIQGTNPDVRMGSGPMRADLATYMEVDDGSGNALHVLGNVAGVLLASAARTATVLGAVLANPYARGILLFVNVTAVSGTTPTLQIRLNAVDPVTGATVILQAFTNITANGEYVYLIYPAAQTAQQGITTALNGILPGRFSVDAVIGGTTPSFTFSAAYQLVN